MTVFVLLILFTFASSSRPVDATRLCIVSCNKAQTKHRPFPCVILNCSPTEMHSVFKIRAFLFWHFEGDTTVSCHFFWCSNNFFLAIREVVFLVWFLFHLINVRIVNRWFQAHMRQHDERPLFHFKLQFSFVSLLSVWYFYLFIFFDLQHVCLVIVASE